MGKMMKKRYLLLEILMALSILLAGCGQSKEPKEGKLYQLYYINDKVTKITPFEYQSKTKDQQKLIEEMLEELRQKPDKSSCVPVIGGQFDIVSYFVSGNTITLNMDERFREVDAIQAILTRAALVRTLTQIDDISLVSMTINGEALREASGTIVGPMQASLFIDNAGDEIGPVETVTLAMYFATQDGKALVQMNRTLDYNSNISMEKLVVEQMINGPIDDLGLPTVNPETKIINVTTKDGICYVNLDNSFLVQTYEVSPEVTIYSIVNSLVELTNVNKVQFSIAGETKVMYREQMDLSILYERNLDLVEK